MYDWDPVAAESFFRRAVELRPDYSLAHTWYAVFLMARGRHDEAIARSEHAAELDPLALTIQALVGQCHYFARRYEEALDRHRATLEVDPGNLRVLIWSARAYRMVGRLDEGLRTIEDAIARHGRLPILLAELGFLMARLGRPEEARAILVELMELGNARYVSAFHSAVDLLRPRRGGRAAAVLRPAGGGAVEHAPVPGRSYVGRGAGAGVVSGAAGAGGRGLNDRWHRSRSLRRDRVLRASVVNPD